MKTEHGRKTPTQKQRDAWNRNWHIRQLRAFFHSIPPPVPPDVRIRIQRLIDDCLVRQLGAESEIERERERERKMAEECY